MSFDKSQRPCARQRTLFDCLVSGSQIIKLFYQVFHLIFWLRIVLGNKFPTIKMTLSKKNNNRGKAACGGKNQGQLQASKPGTKMEKKEDRARAAVPANSAHVKTWMNMVLNPLESQVVKSPASNSVLCSKARFIESRDVSYGQTLGGYFSVVARPSMILPLIIAKAPLRFPAAGSTNLLLSTDSIVFSSIGTDPGFPQSGAATVTDADSSVVIKTQPLIDSAATTHQGFEIFGNTGTNINMLVANRGKSPHYVRGLQRASGGVWSAFGAATLVPAGGTASLASGLLGTNISGVSYAITDSAGAYVNPGVDYNYLFMTVAFNGYIPIATGAGSVYNFVQQKIVDQAGVENCRVTAMSLLVTNMGSATHDGGEIVVANTRQRTIYSAESTAELMSTIKALPEGNRWYSGIMRNGAYTFYTPDDMFSYEPHDYDVINFEDNACVACGKLDPEGSVRIIATYVVEFYTKSQLFERSMGPTWTIEYKLAHQYLQRGRMASGNEDHESMTKRIANNLSRAWKWAWEHKAEIELGAEIALSLL